jgi:polyribonucleotide nucleotidyltransferase
MNQKYEITVDTFLMKSSAETLAKPANGAVWGTSGETAILGTTTVSIFYVSIKAFPFVRGSAAARTTF